MKLIAHRGNFKGMFIDLENSPQYIDQALDLGYEAEIDVWYVDGNFVLGHDNPQYPTDETWLLKRRDKLWCHAKIGRASCRERVESSVGAGSWKKRGERRSTMT